jgi:uncharacterized protein YecT (DUF1311 family)
MHWKSSFKRETMVQIRFQWGAMVRLLLLIVLGFMLPLSAVAQTRSLSEDNSDSVAVIIGNKNYRYIKDFPVDYAVNDANAIKDYLIRFLHFEQRNIIFEQDATKGVFERIFDAQGGDLMGRVREGRSNVFVFYSGHGVPDLVGGQGYPYLLPSDMAPENPQRDGYSLETLYQNLELVKQKIGSDRQVIVMIDACFSGETGKGDRIVKTSAPGFAPTFPREGNGLIKLVATSGSHPAIWDEKLHLGMFTSRFLMGAAGLADAQGRGSIQWGELRKYVVATVDIDARRLGREQIPQITEANFTLPIGEVTAVHPAMQDARDEVAWRTANNEAVASPDEFGRKLAYQNYRAQCVLNGCGHGTEADQRLKEFGERETAAKDRANWARLSAAGKYREYLDTCIEPCAYRKFAEEAILQQQPPPEARDDIAWNAATEAAGASANDSSRRLAYQSYLTECKPNGCRHGGEADARLKEIGERQKVAADRTRWETLGGAGKYQDYIDTCLEPCAYRKLAEDEIKRRTAVLSREGGTPSRPETSGAASAPYAEAAQAWAATKDTTSIAVLDEFIRQFGNTSYGGMARARRDELQKRIALAPLPPVNRSIGPSFECATHHGRDEIAICGNGTLSGLDLELDTLYGRVRNSLSQSRQLTLRDEQRDWLKRRGVCASDVACLLTLYRTRITQLQNWR